MDDARIGLDWELDRQLIWYSLNETYCITLWSHINLNDNSDLEFLLQFRPVKTCKHNYNAFPKDR